MTFKEKWDYFNQHAKFNPRVKWGQTALSFIKNNAPYGIVEFSFKSINNDVYFNRLFIRFNENQESYYKQWYQDILKIGSYWKVIWPDKDVRSFFNKLDWSICDSFYGGFDLRPEIEKSRLKIWCAFRSDKNTIRKLIKYCPFDKNLLALYWKKHAAERILLGWTYNGDGKVSWRVYPGEIPSKYIVSGSKNHVIRKLAPLSEKIGSTWPTSKNLIHWGNINDTEEFIKNLKPLLHSDKAIGLAKDFQQQGFILSNICTALPSTKRGKITESNFYFR